MITNVTTICYNSTLVKTKLKVPDATILHSPTTNLKVHIVTVSQNRFIFLTFAWSNVKAKTTTVTSIRLYNSVLVNNKFYKVQIFTVSQNRCSCHWHDPMFKPKLQL
jgi:hypothetical protein